MNSAFLRAHEQLLDRWAEHAHRELRAMAVARQRGIGQVIRTAARRIRAIQGATQ